ncbi:MAG TPA: YceI family protein [Luteimonas sp.]|jgi:polyisoprenoid-binding protein YceI|nr:YceI family protein [Luteimonas sp.]
MNKRILVAALLAAALPAMAGVPARATGVTYRIDPNHTVVLATWSHFGYSNPSANFGGATGTITYDAAAPEKSSVEVVLPMSGLDTFVPRLDEHLKTADFFDAAQYPQATFRSTSVKALGEGRLEVTGTLELHGVQKPVVLEAKLNKVADGDGSRPGKIGFDATATLKRSDFGITRMIPMVADEVALRITTEAGAETGGQ